MDLYALSTLESKIFNTLIFAELGLLTYPLIGCRNAEDRAVTVRTGKVKLLAFG